MASYSNTELNATIPEIWDMELEDARYATAVIMPRISSKSDKVSKSGDIVHVTIDARLTAGNVGSNGAFTPQVTTPTSVAITVDQHKQVAIELEDKTDAQTFWDPFSRFPKSSGAALAEQYDTDIGALHGDITTNVIGSSSPVTFDKTAFLGAMLKLANTNIPKTSLSFILPPIAFYSGLLLDTQFTSASDSGQPKNVLTTGYQFNLLGVPFYLSTLLTTSGTSIKSFLLHKSALAIAMQINNKYKYADRTAALVLSKVGVVESLYGVKTIRESHAVLINVSNQ